MTGQDLRPHVRDKEPLEPDTVIVRGGPDTPAKLTGHARRTERAFVLDGRPISGVSTFVALDDIGPASLDGLLSGRMATYRSVHLSTAATLSEAGFELIPTFRRPHYTVWLPASHHEDIVLLLHALGPPRPNPYHGRRRR